MTLILIIKAFVNSKRKKSLELSEFNVGGLLKSIIVANGLIKTCPSVNLSYKRNEKYITMTFQKINTSGTSS